MKTRGTPRPDGNDYEEVDIAIVAESTYPYLRGGLSAVVHDIVSTNPDRSIGIIHITWDSNQPQEDIYGMPNNVRWVFPVYQSLEEHVEDFRTLTAAALRTNARGRRALVRRFVDTLRSAFAGDYRKWWQLYDEGMNPRTRSYQIWALLGTKEFLEQAQTYLGSLELSVTELFWLLRELFSLACSILDEDYPKAALYHAHTTGYAALAAAAAARQNTGQFLLTEHNLYTRDTINTLLGRSMDCKVRAEDWRSGQDVTGRQQVWMAWLIEMGRLAYDAADQITYLYPLAIDDAAALGAPVEKAFVVANGVAVAAFDDAHRRFTEHQHQQTGDSQRVWRLAYCARIVPIKGLMDLLDALALLRQRSTVAVTLDVMGPAGEDPEYTDGCYARCTELGLDDVVTFMDNQDLRQVLGDYDLLMLPSYNEGQPIVVLEAMVIGLPVVGTRVGGMQQLVVDPLGSESDHSETCGVLVDPGDSAGLSQALEAVVTDPGFYEHLKSNTRKRVLKYFRLEQAMAAYQDVYQAMIPRAQATQPVAAQTIQEPPTLSARLRQLVGRTPEHGPVGPATT